MSNENQKIPAGSMYYVYVLIDPRNNQPFYVGKGKGNRVESHYYNCAYNKKINLHKSRKIEKLKKLGYKPKYKIVFESSDVKLVFEEEKRLIAKWGRSGYDEDGILTNISLGGDNPPSLSRPVKQYNLFGEYIQTFPSCLAAGNFCHEKSCAITMCCRKKQKRRTAWGYLWAYAEEELDLNWCFGGRKKPVYQWDLEGNFVNKFINGTEATVQFNRKGNQIYKAITNKASLFGFRWTNEFKSPGKYDPYATHKKYTTIYQWTLDGSLLKIYNSVKQAVDESDLPKEYADVNIRKSLKTKRTSYGFKWSTTNEFPIRARKRSRKQIVHHAQTS
jgi:hypothetical protein